MALWNIERYRIVEKQSHVYIDEDPLIFYHFHHFSLLKNGSYDYGEGRTYLLITENIKLIYNPYIKAIEESIRRVRDIDPHFNYGFNYVKKDSLVDRILCLPSKAQDRLKKLI